MVAVHCSFDTRCVTATLSLEKGHGVVMMHFEFTEDAPVVSKYGELVRRIRATEDLPTLHIFAGDRGGYMGDNAVLGDCCWVFDDAVLGGYARLLDNSTIRHSAQVHGRAVVDSYSAVCDHAKVVDDARITSHAFISTRAFVHGKALVSGSTVEDYAVLSHHAQVLDRSRVGGVSRIRDNAVVSSGATVSGYSKLVDAAWVYNTTVTSVTVRGSEVIGPSR